MKRLSVWVPTFSMLLVSLISYVDRNTLALLAPTILRETQLSNEQYGFIISAFSIAYMLGNPVWGRLLDRVGVRAGMLASVSLWTLASISHAFAGGFASFATARAALGFGEGATFPGGLRTAVQTLAPSQRSRGIAVAYSGGSLGAVITPVIVTPIALWWGWRGAFWFTGVIGAMWLALWVIVSRRPELREHHETAKALPAASSPGIRDPRVWGFMSAYALGALPLAFVLYGAAIYLAQVLGKTQAQIGKVLWIPPLGWEVGYFVWGWIADRMLAAGVPPLSIHRRLMGIAMVLSLPLALAWMVRSFPLVMFELFFAMFAAAGFVIVPIAYATHVYSAGYSGLIAGLGAGSWSAVVALVMPVFGRLFDLHRYDAAFLLAAAFPVAGYAGWIIATRPPAADRAS